LLSWGSRSHSSTGCRGSWGCSVSTPWPRVLSLSIHFTPALIAPPPSLPLPPSAPLLEGLVASIGGVDASLSKAASAALLSHVDSDEGGVAGAAAACGGPGPRLAAELVALWQRERAEG
jgi:hypothetical protein